MKRSLSIIFLFLTIAVTQQGKAQLLGGIFSQKSTDLKLVDQQIALLQLYVGWLEKGYTVAREGLTAIGDIKKGDLDLHTNYFNSLKTINPTIQRSELVGVILEREARLLRYCRSTRHQTGLSYADTDYLFQLTGNLIDAGTATVAALTDLLTNDRLTMTDDERIEQLKFLDQDASRQLRFAIQMKSDVTVLAESQRQERNNLNLLQRLHP